MELLAPAGNWQAFVAAVEAGADAVYVGGTRFSARQYADNFTLEQLRRAEEYAHLRDRRLYVAVNTLLDGGEMEEALEYCFLLQELGVDAVIVQDLGLMYLLRRTLPGLRVHASTQMSIHNAAGVALLQRCGVVRVVLARELSAADVASIHRQVPAMELECFVHGALCFSHSGQCLFSSLVGGRSGNRGRCAQPCRLPYSLLAGGREVRTRGEHLLSPADLCLLEALPSLQAAGVSSLKIEGRMKRPEYVATVTAVYRQALDALAGGHFLVREDMRQALEGIFNRTFTTGSWGGEGAHVLNIARPNNRGVLLGRVTFQHPDGRTGIHLLQPLRQGDGIEVWVRRGPNPALTVRELWLGGQAVEEVAAGQEAVVVLQARVGRGDRVFKTHDAALHARAQELMVHNRLAGRIPVWVTARLAAGQPLLVTLRDGEGNQGQAETPSPALPARTRAVSAADLEEKLSRLGATPLVVAGMELQVEEGLMVPFSEVNEARRRAVERLLAKRLGRRRPPAMARTEFQARLAAARPAPVAGPARAARPLLAVAVSTVEQAWQALQGGAERVWVGLEGRGPGGVPDPGDLAALQREARRRGCRVGVALPRILLPHDGLDWELAARVGEAGVLAGSPGAAAMAAEQGLAVHGDYPLNVFNPWAYRFWQERGVQAICLSPELSLQQLRQWPAGQRQQGEVLVHGELPLMVSEYCVVRTALGLQDVQPCPAPCRHADFILRDRRGYLFPLENDASCRSYLFNARTLCMIEELPVLLELGVAAMRIEARRAGAGGLARTVAVYRAALEQLWQGRNVDLAAASAELAELAPSPFTRAHYYRGVI